MRIKNDSLIKKWEKLELTAYLPTPNDVWTIGWGHTKGVYPGMKIDVTTAKKYFREDVAWVEKTIEDLVKVPLNQNQYDALASLIFNIGRTNFSKSTLLRKLNAKDYEGAANEFPRWRMQRGKVLRGLVRRRAEEMAYFLSADKSQEITTTVDDVDPLKNLGKSKELWGGVGAILTGVGSALSGLDANVQLILTVALIGFGIFFVWNRMKARHKGER